MKASLLFLMIVLTTTFTALAQDMKSHQWEDRVLIVMTTDSTLTEFKQQLQLFEAKKEGIQERKLKIYLATPDAYKLWNTDDVNWIQSDALYQTYKDREADLEHLLIGLDGTYKHRWTRVVDTLLLFVTIDTMPMRQTELKHKKQNR